MTDPTPVPVQPLAIGDILRDNDPGQKSRPPMQVYRIQIDGIRSWAFLNITKASCCTVFLKLPDNPSRKTVINLKRIHLDGKPRRSGWSRVSP